MITCTNAQLLPLKSIKVSPVAALGNEFRFVAGLRNPGNRTLTKLWTSPSLWREPCSTLSLTTR